MAGGEGSRLRPLTIGRPKPLVPVVNKAVMGHILDLLKSHGITEIIVTVRYMAAAIQDFFEDGRRPGYAPHLCRRRDAAGHCGQRQECRRLSRRYLSGHQRRRPDRYGLDALVQTHKERGAKASIALSRVPNPLEFGVIITDEDGRIMQFQEKPSWGEVMSDTVNTGIYVLEPEVLDLIPADTNFDFATELFPADAGKAACPSMAMSPMAIGAMWAASKNIAAPMPTCSMAMSSLPNPLASILAAASRWATMWRLRRAPNSLAPSIWAHGVKIKGDVTIYGPCVIRDYTIIDTYTRIERSILWRNNYVGENCELRGTIVTRQCSIKSKAVVFEDSVISDQCVFGRRLHHPRRRQAVAAQGDRTGRHRQG